MTPRNRRRKGRHEPSSQHPPVEPPIDTVPPVAEPALDEHPAVGEEPAVDGGGVDEPGLDEPTVDEASAVVEPESEEPTVDEPVEPLDADRVDTQPVPGEEEPDGDELPDDVEPEPDESTTVDEAEREQAGPREEEPDADDVPDDIEPEPDESTTVDEAEREPAEPREKEPDGDDVPDDIETEPDESTTVVEAEREEAGLGEEEPREAEPREAEPREAEPDEGAPGPVKDPRGAWRRLFLAGSPRATRANVLALVLAGTLGFAIIAQVRQTSIQGLENLREDELVRIFAGVDQDGDRLGDEISGLESSLQLLQSQSTNDAEAQRAAQERLDALGILAGTAPARGPGIVLTIRDPDLEVTSPVVLDAIQELRDAGAEAVQIGDQRVVADTWFSQTDAGISVSGTELRPPYVIRAIGDGNTLAGAMEIPGGVSATVRRAGGETDVQIRDEVDVDALLSLTPPQYARPVPTSSP